MTLHTINLPPGPKQRSTFGHLLRPTVVPPTDPVAAVPCPAKILDQIVRELDDTSSSISPPDISVFKLNTMNTLTLLEGAGT